MENISDYIAVFTQAPLAVIQMFFIYKVTQNYQTFVKEVLKIIKKDNE